MGTRLVLDRPMSSPLMEPMVSTALLWEGGRGGRAITQSQVENRECGNKALADMLSLPTPRKADFT